MHEEKVTVLKGLVALFLVATAGFFAVSTLRGAGSGAVVSATERPGEGEEGGGAWAAPKNPAAVLRKLAGSHVSRLSPAWEMALGGEAFLEQEGGLLYVASSRGQVLAVDAANGSVRWSLDLGAWVSAPPRVEGGMVYIGATNRVLYALDAATGALIWYYPAQGEILAQPVVGGGRVFFCADNDSVYNLIYRLYALDARGGTLLWTYDTRSWTPAAPAAGSDAVYLGGYQRDVCSLSGASGEKAWSFTAPNIVFSSPRLAEDRLVFACIDGSVYALDAATGGTAWSVRLPGFISLAPYVGDGRIYVCSVSGVTALSRDGGEKLWSFAWRNILSCAAVPEAGAAYVFDERGMVIELDAASGERRRMMLVRRGCSGSPLIAGDRIYVSSPDGLVRAYHIPGEKTSE